MALPEAEHAGRYLDPKNLALVGSLELRARMIAEGVMTGMHRSPQQGYSVEFAQHRAYAPGDDLRHLDWKVYARTDKLYIKQYQKETNLDLMVLLDASSSMAFQSEAVAGWRKYDHAASIAATLAYLALKQSDRVGLMLFDQDIVQQVRTSNAKDHWQTLVEAISSIPPTPLQDPNSHGVAQPRTTDLARLFDIAVAKLRRRSLVVLISDLLDDPSSVERGLARLSYRRHDVVVLQVLDHAERTFPYRSAMEFIGLEGEGRINLDPAALRAGYQQALGEHLRAMEETVRRFGFDYLLLDSSEPLGGPLSHLLAKRAALLSRGKLS